ncbi:MAG: hypothetical protein CMN79_04005 [Spirochaetales bacterium]|jgi:membrane protein required for colicin V production|nr:hypothetical protein [Spirochaetales bacterium]
MNIYDYVFLVMLALSTVGGFFFGLVKTFSKFSCLFIPFVIAYTGSDLIRSELIERFGFFSGYGSKFIASLFAYIFLYLSLRTLFFLIESIIKALNMGLLNRILGLCVGFITGGFLGYLFLILALKISRTESIIYLKIQHYITVFFTI